MSSTKIKTLIAAAVIVSLIIVVLMYNKAKIKEKVSKTTLIKDVPVSVATVSKENIDQNLYLVGTVYANNDVNVASEATGKVTHVYFNVGDKVCTGKVLVKVDDELKQAALVSAEETYNKTKKDLERNMQLLKTQSVTDQQVETARQAFKSAENQLIIAKRQLNDTKVVAPFSGVVTTRNVDPGAMLMSGTVVANIVDISNLKIKVNVAENDAFKLKTGAKVKIGTDVYEGTTFTGTVRSIGSKGDEAHTFPVEITLANNNSKPLRAGMFAKVFFEFDKGQSSVVIPREALVGSIKNPQVFVIEGNIAKLRNINLRAELGQKLVVLGGLNEGEIVVTNGQINLKDNTQVSIIK